MLNNSYLTWLKNPGAISPSLFTPDGFISVFPEFAQIPYPNIRWAMLKAIDSLDPDLLCNDELINYLSAHLLHLQMQSSEAEPSSIEIAHEYFININGLDSSNGLGKTVYGLEFIRLLGMSALGLGVLVW